MPILKICDYYIHQTDLADISSFKRNLEISQQISKYFLPLESGILQLEQPKFPVFSLCFKQNFPDRDLFWPFSMFSLCSGYPVNMNISIHEKVIA